MSSKQLAQKQTRRPRPATKKPAATRWGDDLTEGFDFIVVGAGSAGAVIGARLTEDASKRVLLVEAGPDYRSNDAPEEMQSPNFWRIVNVDGYQWTGLKAKRTSVQGPRPYLRGRGVGGSSAINAQGAVRGLPGDFDSWANGGCAGWSWVDVLPDFIRLEEDLDFADRPYHGRNGPTPISRLDPVYWGPLGECFASAALTVGHCWNDDINAPDSTGLSRAAFNRKAGRRVSTNDAYLEPARPRPNLKIMGEGLVERVAFRGSKVLGVYIRRGRRSCFVEGAEVILCAGAIHSPAILMRSGIGPAVSLSEVGITPLIDLPVGQNLCDQPVAALRLVPRPNTPPRANDTPLGSVVLRCTSNIDGCAPNDLAIYPLDIGDEAGNPGLLVAVMQPFSRGYLKIAARRASQHPIINLCMLEDRRDVVRLKKGIHHAVDILRQKSCRVVIESVATIGCGNALVESTDAEIHRCLRAECEEFLHAVGSCRMGSPTDPTAVVDPECRVLGTEGLRVADASVMPSIPRAGTHLSSVMLAEHLADRLPTKRKRRTHSGRGNQRSRSQRS